MKYDTQGLLKFLITKAKLQKTTRFDILKQYNIKITYHRNKVFYQLEKKKKEECIEQLEQPPQNIQKHLQYLRSVQSNAQKSVQWYKLRSTMITASDIASALGQNKYEPVYKFILKKLGYVKSNYHNKYCIHGNHFEPVARFLFEQKNQVKVEEFGLIPHKQLHFIGASPDGIFIKDGKLFLLEIKCPLTRKIKTTGTIYGNICPEYYWIQMQIQMEVCNIDVCYFLQCKFVPITKEQYEQKQKMGKIIGFYIRDKMQETNIYEEYITLEKALKKYEDKERYEIIYWENPIYSCVKIERNKEWFQQNIDQLRLIWNYIVMFQRDKEKKELFLKYLQSLYQFDEKKIMNVIEFLYKNDLTQHLKKKILKTIKNNHKKKEFQEYTILPDDIILTI